MLIDAVEGLMIELDEISHLNSKSEEVDIGDGDGSTSQSRARSMESIKGGTNSQENVMSMKRLCF